MTVSVAFLCSLVLAVVLYWTFRAGPQRRVVAVATALVFALLAVEWVLDRQSRDREHFHQQVEAGYSRLWQQLDDTAERSVERLGAEPLDPDQFLRAFQILSEETRRDPRTTSTILLLDDVGEVVAWAGKGLLHTLDPVTLPPNGRTYLASFSAVSLLAVRPLVTEAGVWRVAAGRSLRTDRLPFVPGFVGTWRWTVVRATAELPAGAVAVPVEGGPSLVVEPAPVDGPSLRLLTWRLRRGCWLIWGLVMLGLAWRGSRSTGRPFWVAVIGGAGLALLGIAMEEPRWLPALLFVAGGLALGSWIVGPRIQRRGLAVAMGILATLAPALIARLIVEIDSISDLGGQLWTSPADYLIRIALVALVASLFGLVGGSPRPGPSGRPGWLATSLVLLLLAAASVGQPLLGLGLLVAGGTAFALSRLRQQGLDRPVAAVLLAVVAVVSAATGWELAFRSVLRRQVEEVLLPALAPPTAEEIEAIADEMHAFLGSSDIETLAPAGVADLARQDLGFEIWHHSPLAGYGGLTAMRVQPYDGGSSSFSFGLPLNPEGWVDWSLPIWESANLPVWDEAVLVGDGQLRFGGEPWAYVEYALVLQPGFRLPLDRGGDLAAGLLRADPQASWQETLGIGELQYALFDSAGKPLASPWEESPRLPETLLAGGRSSLRTPSGNVEAFSAVGEDGVRVLFLPQVGWLASMERIGTHALAALLTIGLLFLVWQLPTIWQQGLRVSWLHVWRSYSRRLVLVYSILLLLPLVLMNLLVVRALEERIRSEQAAAGQAALESSQQVLGEYVLALEPGFVIDAALDDELLGWLAGVVHHDVNLYWRGLVYASSKAELFTAGLLPRRIPGEIYSRLTLLGHRMARRTNQAGGTEYLELYAPLRVPGVAFDEARLFLSLPLLAQQEETAAQIASLRQRAVLATVALMLLISAVGVRLARRFTAPLTDIVDGTQRIAAGERSLNLQPTELELATLVDAIDEMADKIARGREQLLREKRVVDRMVENITSGVVSLDEMGRVLMANRVAVELVGVEIGRDLPETVARQERLAPLLPFLEVTGDREPAQATVRLQDAQGNEQEWALVWVPLPGAGEPSALLVLEDVTEVLRGQRLEAWAEMARMIAHEIKNPLTPIRLSAEHMREVHASEPESFQDVFESCTANILKQVGELQEIATEFSTYSRIPKIDMEMGNLTAAVEEIVSSYRAAPPRGIHLQFESASPDLEIAFDARLLGRAVRNLIENALRASPDGGTVAIAVDKIDSLARIVVADTGPGVDSTLIQRIFDPYFSTHDAGTGLGLPIARQIAEEHGGEVTARNRESGGLEVTIALPIDAS